MDKKVAILIFASLALAGCGGETTSLSSGVSSVSSSSSFLSDDSATLSAAKQAAIAVIDAAYQGYSESAYRASTWTSLTAAYQQGKEAINAASSLKEVTEQKNLCLSSMATLPTLSEDQAVPFPFSANFSGLFKTVPNDAGDSVAVSWEAFDKNTPAAWSWQNLSTPEGYDLGQNYPSDDGYTMKVSNTGKQALLFMLSFTDGFTSTAQVVGKSDILSIAAGASQIIAVSLSGAAKAMYVFPDTPYVSGTYEPACLGGSCLISDFHFTQSGSTGTYDTGKWTISPSETVLKAADKEGAVENLSWSNKAVGWHRVAKNVTAALGQSLFLTLRNNSSAKSKVILHGGHASEIASDWFAFTAYYNDHTSWNGSVYQFTGTSGETATFQIKCDSAYSDKAIDTVYLEVDEYYDGDPMGSPTAVYSGNMDIVSLLIK